MTGSEGTDETVEEGGGKDDSEIGAGSHEVLSYRIDASDAEGSYEDSWLSFVIVVVGCLLAAGWAYTADKGIPCKDSSCAEGENSVRRADRSDEREDTYTLGS